ncbi:hypothetical protein SAMN05216228_100860 [Rhizobium tibeticum]|uniref:Uncharacterized protein n=1 Tax=Rhizobium tibeticum TaxID=501024 RepID=A0A1H8JTZ5_9HYPH|nr:hypothetical protein [Rhizobium tibeticum]SEH79386.1 hypothetical protein RTCCBAU85039_2398 [Rhizobium tibeticum]SEN84214.1 hypothetical protein SAMN05216228_100860 [Rhizobium tibeticum]
MSSIVANRYYNNPEIGQAFSSLATLFAPPSGSDLAGYAAAGAKRAEAARLAELFDYSKNPNFNQTVFDRMGVGAGAYAPSQSYYSVDQGNATTRRGQDIAAQTSTANNAADNARALQTSAMDNQRSAIASLYGPLSEGQVRPAVPADIAAHVGLPAIDEAKGAAKPLTTDEWQAQNAERLRQSGAIGDQQLLDAIMGKETPVQAVGPDGKTPVFMTPGAATRTGAQPYDQSADKSLVEGTALVNGKTMQVFRRPNESIYRTADGQPIPTDIQVFDKARPVGTSDQIGMKQSEFTQKNAMFYNRAASAAANLEDLQNNKGYAPGAADYELMLGKTGDVLPLSLSNNLVSPEGRQFYNSAMNFMLSVLRPDTGAAFGREEFQNYARVFIPLPGDDPQTIADKKVARDTALAALQGSSAGAADQITRIMQANGVPVPPEMLAHMQAAQANAPTQSVQQSAQPQSSAQPSGDPLASARAAIAKGAPRDKVIQRLIDNGIDPKGL